MDTQVARHPLGWRLMKFARFVKRGLLFLASLLLVILLAEGLSSLLIKYRSLDASWTYLTVADPDIGFVLRPGIFSKWCDVPNWINQSGLRDYAASNEVRPRENNEFIILVLGDSNTYGNGVPFETTYSEQLRALLAPLGNRKLRVLNLGAPGSSTYQARRILARWLHLRPDVVILADSWNNRVTVGPESKGGDVDDEETMAAWTRSRYFDIRGHLSRSLYVIASFTNFAWTPAAAPQLSLTGSLPRPRVPLSLFETLVSDLSDLAARGDFHLIFLAAGDEPHVEQLAGPGLSAFAAGRWEVSAEIFGRMIGVSDFASRLFLPWYYRYRSLQATGNMEGASALRRAYETSRAGREYMSRGIHFATEYIAVLQRVSATRKVSLVDVREIFLEKQLPFGDITHFGSLGHAIIAEALARKIQSQFPQFRKRSQPMS